MRVECRRFKTTHEFYKVNLLVIPETDAEKEILDEMGPLDTTLEAELRLSDGYGDYYLLVVGKENIGP